MRKILLLLTLLIFGLVGIAGATMWTDTYTPEPQPLYMSTGDEEDVTFDITNDGFDPGFLWWGDTALWAQVELYVTDDLSPWYDGFDLFGSDEMLSVSTDFLFWNVEEQSYEVDFNLGLLNDPLLYDVGLLGLISLNADGEIGLTLTAEEGDFYFWGATITASDTAPVPEPSTWLLLGSGLAGLALYRRRKAA